ncbi:MAG: precorrin-6A reductase [Firmicutes bacterium]|nr:precorrin-6A reductase [Bacillota bacterium]
MIIVLGGTAEGRQMVSLLNQEAWPHTACVVSRYGAELLGYNDSTRINQGRLDVAGLISLIIDTGAALLVDATHPFATEISRIGMEAATTCKIDYVRLERDAAVIPNDPLVKKVQAMDQIEEFLRPQQVVFSTLGSRHLPLLVPLVKRAGARLVARVLPVSGVVQECEGLGLTPDSIVAVQGPFSKELNQRLFEHYGAQLILSKDSGAAGGLEEKLEAAREMGITIVVWMRPPLNYLRVYSSPEEVLQYIKAEWGGMFR